MKCVGKEVAPLTDKLEDCQNRASVIFWNEIENKLESLCEFHLGEIREMEGELNIDYYDIDDLESILHKANEVLSSWYKQYTFLLNEGNKK